MDVGVGAAVSIGIELVLAVRAKTKARVLHASAPCNPINALDAQEIKSNRKAAEYLALRCEQNSYQSVLTGSDICLGEKHQASLTILVRDVEREVELTGVRKGPTFDLSVFQCLSACLLRC